MSIRGGMTTPHAQWDEGHEHGQGAVDRLVAAGDLPDRAAAGFQPGPGQPDLRRSPAVECPGSSGSRARGLPGHRDASRWLVKAYSAERPPRIGILEGPREPEADPVPDSGYQVPRQVQGH